MNQDKGLSGEGVQNAICTGQNYGGKEWSESERQEACERLETLTGKTVDTPSSTAQNFDVAGIVIIGLVILVVVAYALYRTRRGSRKND